MQFTKTILTRERSTALTASVIGVVLFYALDLPLPFMLGPMFGCLVAALAGARLQGLGWLATAMRIVLGIAVGTAITPMRLPATTPGLLSPRPASSTRPRLWQP